MSNLLKNPIFFFSVLALLISGCQSNRENDGVNENFAPKKTEPTPDPEEAEIEAVLDRILIAVGNRDVQELRELSFNRANIGWTYLQDGVWKNKEVTIEEYLSNISETEHPSPISETALNYDISVTEGRIAFVTLPTVISQFGVARSKEVNHVTMVKANDQWKLFSVAWTVHRIPEEERTFDLDLFAHSYAQVWGSNRPAFVSMFFEEDGALHVNDGEPAIGREAISNVAQSFMTKFPDMKVSFDSLVQKPNGTEFHWTLTGTDAGPGGKGHKVKVSGYEFWTLSEGKLIKNSQGHFPTEEYNRQLEFGIDN